MVRIGVIGGSGLYEMSGLTEVRAMAVATPFGDPSAPVTIGRLEADPSIELCFLPRHGLGHSLNPSEVNYRANIFALKKLGVEWVLAVSAVGSLKEEIVPGEMVAVSQFIDRTSGRPSTFFQDGIVAHVGFAEPICSVLRGMLVESCREVGATVHDGGVYVNIEGPAFSTRAESHLYRSWGADVIGMTAVVEAKLAREAELSYALLSMATDYDCWREGHDAVTVEEVVATMRNNVGTARRVIRAVAPRIAAHVGPAPHSSALKGAIMTSPAAVPLARLLELAPLVGKYLPARESRSQRAGLVVAGLAALAGVLAVAVLARRGCA